MSRKDLQAGDRQDLTQGDRSTVSVTDRQPIELPARPSFWISGLDEPNAPSVGSGDQSPTNMVGYSDLSANQLTSNDQPIWEDGYWQINNDLWNVQDFPLYLSNTYTVAAVYNYSGSFNTDAIFSKRDAGDFNPSVALFFGSSDDTLWMNYAPSSGGSETLKTGSVVTTGEDALVVARWEGLRQDTQIMSIWFYNSVRGFQKASKTYSNVMNGVPTNHQTIGALDQNASSGGLDNCKLYDLLEFRNGLTDNQIEGYLIPWLKYSHGIGQNSNPPLSTRIPVDLPVTPDVHVDASTEPAAPADGAGDERPTNRAVYSDLDISQSSGTSQPTWDDSNELWDLTDDDYWDVDVPQGFPHTAVIWGVVGPFSIGMTDNPYLYTFVGSSGHATDSMRIQANLSANEVFFQIREDGTFSNPSIAASDGVDFMSEQVAFVQTVDYPAGRSYVTAKSPTGVATDSATSNLSIPSVEVTSQQIGALSGGSRPDVDLYEMAIELGGYLNDTEADDFRDYLADKWGIS